MRLKSLLRAALFSMVVLLFSFTAEEVKDNPYKLIVFEGSDWCHNCIRFEKTVLAEETFLSFAAEHHIAIERIDFPQRNEQDPDIKEYNAGIAEKYDFKGVFPTVLLVDTETNEVVELRYRKENADEFISLLKTHIP